MWDYYEYTHNVIIITHMRLSNLLVAETLIKHSILYNEKRISYKMALRQVNTIQGLEEMMTMITITNVDQPTK